MQLQILGPVEASADGRALPLGGAKPRAVLAMLGLEGNRTVGADRLIEGLWGEHPPASAAKMLQTYVWRLRRTLGEHAGADILTRGRGYELRIDPDAVDVLRFERLLAAANRAEAAGEATDVARRALALWRGPALADVIGEPFAAPAARRLEELRVEAAELAVEADLAAGRHHDVLGELDALVAEHPLRERLHAQRMLALYRCGRQAEALEAYRTARRTLVEEIGVEPGTDLRRRHDAILAQDPALDVEAAAPTLPRELDASRSPPIAGRDAELARLRAHWRRARDGAGAVVALAGVRGMGKSRLGPSSPARRTAMEPACCTSGRPRGGSRCSPPSPGHASRRVPGCSSFDEADRADDVLCDELGRLGDELRAIPALVIAAGEDPRALARLRPGDVLALAPLDEHAVRRIAVLYAPAGAEADVPVGVLVETSGGVPRRVHEVAGEWARRAAAQRVDAIAPRAAAGRRDARALEAALAGSLADLQAADERAALATDDIDGGFEAVACPYKGLAGFDVDDAEVFFGRERLVADLVARLVGAPLLGVVGPSGSGKSSVVRAGLMPALAAGMLPGSERWVRAVVRPGEHPLRELRRLAGPHVDGRRLVLVVDQFEELFTACRDAAERSAAVAELVGAAARGTLVVLALRADFYGRCADHPELSALLEANHVLVGPMGPDELSRAIELPARRAHLRLEPGLVDRLLADCEGEPGALPLLSTALLELWLAREGRELRMAAYERSGGMRGAVARLAEAAYGRLDAAQQVIAHRILLRLAGDDVHGVPVRRRVPLDELEGGVEVLAALADARLVTVDEATAEVAHEALLLEWPRLRGWLEEDADGRRLHRRLIQSAREWSAGGRDRGDLYRGARLAAALEWGAEHEPELTAVEREFLDAARAAAERSRRRLRLAFLGALALLAVATGAAALALEQRGRARENAKAAAARGLGAAALTEERLDRSLLLARQGVALDDAPASRGALLAALQRGPAAVAVIPGDGDALNAIALHPDGRTLAVGDDGGSVHLLDAVTRRRLGPPHQVTSAYLPRITALAFSPDGARLASAAANPGAFVDLFDVAARRHVARVAESFAANEASVGFSPNGRVLAVHMTAGARSAGPILLGDAALGRGARVPPDLTVPHASTLLGVLDTGGRAVTTSADAGTTLIRGAATPRPVRAFPVAGAVAAMSREAALVAFGRRDGSVRLLDLRSGELRRARGSHEGPVVALGFDPAGDRLVTAGGDQRLIVWDAARATALERLEARGIGSISDVAVGRDGGTAYTAGRDGAVVAWDLTGARRWERPFATDGGARAATSLATAAQGTHLAVADARGFVDVLEAGGLRLAARIRPRRGWVSGAQLSADGGTLALMAHDGAHTALELWDVRTRRRLGPPAAAHAGPATALSFSRDGRRLATGGNDAFVHVWDARHGRAEGSADLGVVGDVALSPDGRRLAVAMGNNFAGGLVLHSVPALEPVRTLPLPPGSAVRFSRDGRTLVFGSRDGRVWRLDTRTWTPRGRPLDVGDPIRGIELSHDGRLLVTASDTGSGRLWDLASGDAVGTRLSGVARPAIGAAFLRGGGRLAVMHADGGVVWDVRASASIRRACAVAGRTLTRAEWEAVLPGRGYAPACAGADRP